MHRKTSNSYFVLLTDDFRDPSSANTAMMGVTVRQALQHVC